MNKLPSISKAIKSKAEALGFDACGIAKANFLEDEALLLETWLKKGYHGKMHYMENHFDKRLDPRLLVNNAKSVITLSYNYFPSETQKKDRFKISKYAYGKDYHFVIKSKLKELLQFMQQNIGEIHGRGFVDSAPVMERSWASKSGLGWQGKHTLLIQKNKGSYHFLAVLIVDVALDYDEPFKTDHCGSCTRCIDACPTQAILPNQILNASKCISYLTIELKDEIPNQFKGKLDDWMFGCDICQDVCPWNRFSKPHNEPAFNPHSKLLEMDKNEWEEITADLFQEIFKKSAVKRTKYSGLKRNISFLSQTSNT
ncbi:MAG TPA: tRNA epoxyqueuosine(34) reductase QueG [Flavobacteriaceae bacterium]|nr:tRNA epoxyqueuosine(34) reductase QueG [Flavobacteriaceae bacterium]